jgi:fructokinase
VLTDPGGSDPAGTDDCLTVVGETLVDLIPDSAHSEYVAHLGGSPANVAVGLARLGQPTFLITQTGSDAHGRFARARLAEEDVRVIEAGPDGPASTALVTLDDHGRARYKFDVRWEINGVHVPAACAAVHVGSLGLVLEPGCAEVMRLLTAAGGRTGRLVSLDPNIRADMLPDPEAARQNIRRAAGLADVVKLSDEDLDLLFPGAKPRQAGDLLLGDPMRGGPGRTQLVVVTLGGGGALAPTRPGRGGPPPPPRPAAAGWTCPRLMFLWSTRSAPETRSCPACSQASPNCGCSPPRIWPCSAPTPRTRYAGSSRRPPPRPPSPAAAPARIRRTPLSCEPSYRRGNDSDTRRRCCTAGATLRSRSEIMVVADPGLVDRPARAHGRTGPAMAWAACTRAARSACRRA